MRKLIICLLVLPLLYGCVKGKFVKYEMEEGDLRILSTKDYLIVEKCVGFHGFTGRPFWATIETVNKKDRFGCYDLLENILCKK